MPNSTVQISVCVDRGHWASWLDVRQVGSSFQLASLPEHIIEGLWLDGYFDPGPTKTIDPSKMKPEKLREAIKLVELKIVNDRTGESHQNISKGTVIRLYRKNNRERIRIFEGIVSKIEVEIV